MNELKIINKKIRNVTFELIFTIIIFILAYGVWLNPNVSMAVFASSNESQTVLLEEVNPLRLDIYPVDDNTAINQKEKGLFKLTNNSNVNSKYSIIYRVNKTSTLDYSFLKYQLVIDDKSSVDFLSNLEINEENNYTDFILYSGELDKNSEKTFEYTMWLDSKVGNEAQNKSLSAQFVVKSYGTEITMR